MISLRSQVTQKILNYFFINPDTALYVNELARTLGLDKRNLVKKLRSLETEGLLRSQVRGNLKLYSMNKGFPLYKEYKGIVLGSVGLGHRLGELVRGVRGVKEAYLFGSFAENKERAHSDVDLLVVGDHEMMELQRKINPFQNEIGREINVVNIDGKEFLKRLARKDPFLTRIFSGKTRKLI